jgi:hypothetical protein
MRELKTVRNLGWDGAHVPAIGYPALWLGPARVRVEISHGCFEQRAKLLLVGKGVPLQNNARHAGIHEYRAGGFRKK